MSILRGLHVAIAVAMIGCSSKLEDHNVATFDSKTPFKILLEGADDFDLVDSTFVKIGDRYDHEISADRYTPEERVIMLVWHSSGIVDNGGFEYLFSGDFPCDPDFKLTAEAYKTVGLQVGYESFQDAFRLFPGGQVPHDSEERIKNYKSVDENVRNDINRKFFTESHDKSREKQLAKYIRENAAKFGDLDSKPD
jgi:hypothetical protein